jgi:NitT/TauT family transport system permease protein
VFLGIVSSFNKFIYNFLYPVNSILKSIPTIAFILIALIWLNKNYAPYLIGIVIAFPILYETTINSLINGNSYLNERLKLLGCFFDKFLIIHIQSIIISYIIYSNTTFSLSFESSNCRRSLWTTVFMELECYTR